nr:coat protein [Chrysanthemum yellow edge associated virus 2]
MEDRESINTDIKLLQTLMDRLNIIEDDNQENNEIIYDYSDIEDIVQPMDVGEPSDPRKRRPPPKHHQPPKGYEEYPQTEAQQQYMYRQGYFKREARIIPEEKYNPVINPEILNIDCVNQTQAKTILENWSNKLNLEIQLNEQLRTLVGEEIYNYIMHKTSGHVFLFLNNQKTSQLANPNWLANQNKPLAYIVNAISSEFLGTYVEGWKTAEQIQKEEYDALYYLMNLRVCNMCYLDQYTCTFQSKYYLLKADTQALHQDLIFQKLPPLVSIEAQKYFEEQLQNGLTTNTLGARIKSIKDWQTEQCNKKLIKQQAQITLCCNKAQNIPPQFGCYKPKKLYKYKYKKRFIRRRKYNNSYYKNNNFFRRRRDTNKKYTKNQKYCPNKKKDCKCWLCKEDGHYANECPKRKTKDVAKPIIDMFNFATSENLEPIEDSDFDTDDELYLINRELTDTEDSETDSDNE